MAEKREPTWANTIEEEDRVEMMIRKSGCWDNHIAVVECYGEHGDWRKCQDQVQAFKACMMKNSKVQSNPNRDNDTAKK